MKKKATELDATAKKLFDNLIAELRTAIPKSYGSLAKEFPDLCGFAIGTTAYIEFITPMFQRSAELEEDDPAAFERFVPPEWAASRDKSRNDTLGEKVDAARVKLCEHCKGLDVDTSCDIRCEFLDALLDLLVELDTEKKLGPKTDERYLTMWIAGDDDECLINASKKLNTLKTHKYVQEALS